MRRGWQYTYPRDEIRTGYEDFQRPRQPTIFVWRRTT